MPNLKTTNFKTVSLYDVSKVETLIVNPCSLQMEVFDLVRQALCSKPNVTTVLNNFYCMPKTFDLSFCILFGQKKED